MEQCILHINASLKNKVSVHNYKAHLHKVAFLSTVTSLGMPMKQKTYFIIGNKWLIAWSMQISIYVNTPYGMIFFTSKTRRLERIFQNRLY